MARHRSPQIDAVDTIAESAILSAKRRRSRLPTDEFSRTLFKKSSDAFAKIFRVAGLALQAAFEIELLLVRIIRAFPVKPANEPERHIRIAYIQSVPRLEEAVARMRRFVSGRP